MDQGGLADVLSRFGTIKNPVLLSSSTFSSGMLWFGKGLVEHPSPISSIPAITGFGMVLLSAVIFLTGLGFYAYAFLRLPASTQELMFLQEGRLAVEQHETAIRKRRRAAGRIVAAGQEAPH
ncbi:MAG TPA: hypothetical protein VMB73_15065 [Acetobacteraceae bacterium]|nr:hypothetical protein [Acetobacteraceae bacterium]